MSERRIWRLWVAVCLSTVFLQVIFGWFSADERREAEKVLAISHVIQQGLQGSMALLEERLSGIESQLKADWTLLDKIPEHVEKIRRDFQEIRQDLQRYATIAKPEIEYRFHLEEQFVDLRQQGEHQLNALTQQIQELKIDLVNIGNR